MNWSHTLDERIIHHRRSTRKNDVNSTLTTKQKLQLAGYWHRNEEQSADLMGDEAA